MAKIKRRQIKKRKKGNYELCWEFLKESKVFLLIISLIFIFSTIFGFIFPLFFTDIIQRFLQDIFEATRDLNLFQLIIYIIQNNLISSLSGMVLGIFLGVFPLLTTLMNGYVLGFVGSKSAAVYGASILLRIIPHGIFEIPALIISLGLGLRLGMFVFAKNKGEELSYLLKNSFRIFIFIIIPLLLAAGIIESLLIFVLG